LVTGLAARSALGSNDRPEKALQSMQVGHHLGVDLPPWRVYLLSLATKFLSVAAL